ncbi:hypothetical protein HWB02_gp067 [Klebsiella phage KNP2]|uniref:hypothetical protein n=1 Tax=Klebsiella phage KNP2 TaxID=1871716 RepID=UPI0018AD4514|nr:hypothetical protein HWB02_gp067 [Klebsiella phage KNP2]
MAEKERIELSSRFTSQHLSKVFSSPIDLLLHIGVASGTRTHIGLPHKQYHYPVMI